MMYTSTLSTEPGNDRGVVEAANESRADGRTEMRALCSFRMPLAVAIVVVLGTSCGDDGGPTSPTDNFFDFTGNVANTDFTAEASFSSEIPVASQTQLALRGINGSVVVSGRSDSSSILVNAVRRVRSESSADAEANLERLQVRVTDLGTQVLVETSQPQDSGGRSFEVDYAITLPRTLEVSVTNVNGAVTIENINAPVNVLNTNGELELQNIVGSVIAEGVNGRIEATSTLPRAGRIELALVNGNVELAIPQNTSATLSARTSNGTVTLSNLSLSSSTSAPSSVQGTLGGGDGTIILTTVNGTIRVSGF